MKKRGESQFPEAGVAKEWPTYSVYSGTQPRPVATGIWRRGSAEAIHEHVMSPEATERRRAARGQYKEI